MGGGQSPHNLVYWSFSFGSYTKFEVRFFGGTHYQCQSQLFLHGGRLAGWVSNVAKSAEITRNDHVALYARGGTRRWEHIWYLLWASHPKQIHGEDALDVVSLWEWSCCIESIVRRKRRLVGLSILLDFANKISKGIIFINVRLSIYERIVKIPVRLPLVHKQLIECIIKQSNCKKRCIKRHSSESTCTQEKNDSKRGLRTR